MTGDSVQRCHEVETNDTYNWDSIPDIEGDAKQIETKVKARNASNVEKIMYKKHAYKRIFEDQEDTSLAQALWDNGYVERV